MSRNQNRLGSGMNKAPNADIASTLGLSFPKPVETVRLPSKGQFYPEGHPLHNQEEVEIGIITGKEEDILCNPAFIKNNTVIDKLTEALLVDKTIDVKSLLSVDRTAIGIAARISAYGSDFKQSARCPACSHVNEFDFELSEPTISEPDFQDNEDVEWLGGNMFKTIGPISKFEVVVRIPTVQIEQEIIKLSKEDAEFALKTTLVRKFIVSINGHDDPALIKQYVEEIPAKELMHISKIRSSIEPTLTFHKEMNCEQCGHEMVIQPMVTKDFFYPYLD